VPTQVGLALGLPSIAGLLIMALLPGRPGSKWKDSGMTAGRRPSERETAARRASD